MIRSPFVATAVAISIVLRAQINEPGVPIVPRTEAPQEQSPRSQWSALTALNRHDEIFVTQGRSTVSYRFAAVDESSLHVVLNSRPVDIPRASVDRVAIPGRSETRTQVAFISFGLASAQFTLLFSVPKRPPLFFWIGAGLSSLGALLLRRTHVVIYERDHRAFASSRAPGPL
jgi:hypothetical protein